MEFPIALVRNRYAGYGVSGPIEPAFLTLLAGKKLSLPTFVFARLAGTAPRLESWRDLALLASPSA